MNAAPQPHARAGSARIAVRRRIGVLGTFPSEQPHPDRTPTRIGRSGDFRGDRAE